MSIAPPAGPGSAAQAFDHDYLGREVMRRRGDATWVTTEHPDRAPGPSTRTESSAGASSPDQLVARVGREKRNKEFDEYVKGLRSGAPIIVNDAELEKIAVPAPPGVDVARGLQGAAVAPPASHPVPPAPTAK